MSEVIPSITFDDLHDVPNLQLIDQWCIAPPLMYKPEICVGVTLPEVSSIFRPPRTESEQQRRREVLGILQQADDTFFGDENATTPPRSSADDDSEEEDESPKDGGRGGTGDNTPYVAVVQREDAQTQTIPTAPTASTTTTTTRDLLPTSTIVASSYPVASSRILPTPILYQPQLLCYSPYQSHQYTVGYSHSTPTATAAATTAVVEPALHDASAPILPPPASQPVAATVMCCYYKQQGWCKMGERCWYMHHGEGDTPCHYGSACQAGHSHLTTAPPLARARRPNAGGGEPKADTLKNRFKIHNPCAVCGAAPAHLLGRRIPVWNEAGQGVSMCVRASCGVCGSSYLL